MSLRDSIIDKFRSEVEKQNPWMPYRGEAGGQGWQNMITGEIRYQDARPGAQEGMPEEYDGDVPTPEEEPPDELGPPEIDPAEAFEDADEIEIEMNGEVLDATITDIVPGIEGSGPVVEDENGEEYQVTWDEVLTDPEEGYYADEPPDGWAGGWQEAPDDLNELEEGQIVEVYDLETGEYKEAEVTTIHQDDPDAWGEAGYIVAETEEGESYEILPDAEDLGDEALLTAAEDMDWVEGLPEGVDAISIEEAKALDEGDHAVVQMEDEIFPDEPIEVEMQEDGKLKTVEEIDGTHRVIDPSEQGHIESLEGIWAETPEFVDPMTIPGFAEDPELVEGSVAMAEHPVFGELEGEVEVDQDPEGNHWVSFGRQPLDPEDLEPGDDIFWNGGSGDGYEAEFLGEATPEWWADSGDMEPDEVPSDYYLGQYIIGTSDGEEYVAEPDEIHTQAEATLTTNPEHPMYIGDHAEGIESPWEETTEAGDFADVKPGDKLTTGDGVVTVSNRTADGLELETGEFYEAHELSGAFDGKQTEELPRSPPIEDWDESVPDSLKPEDTVAYYDPEDQEIKRGEVLMDYGDSVEIANAEGHEEDIPQERIHAWADTGEVQLPDGDYIGGDSVGEYVEVTWKDHAGDIHTNSGFVTNFEDHIGEAVLMDTETGEMINIDAGEATITDRPEMPEEYQGSTGEPPDVVADEMAQALNVGRPDELKGEVRAELYGHYDPESVQNLMNALVDGGSGAYGSPWKRDSNNQLANQWEEALAGGVGISAPVLGGDRTPSSEEKKVAEAIHELSKRRWEENTPDHIYRGLSDAGAAALVSEYLTDPADADEYRVPTRAVANYSESQSRAENLGTSPVVVYRSGDEVPSDWVAAYHDDFFAGPNDTEQEISMRGDTMKVPRDQFYVDKNEARNFGAPPHEWDEDIARAFKQKLDAYGASDILDNYNNRPEAELQQLENAVRIERVMNENGVITTNDDFFNEVRDRLRNEYDRDPEAVEYPELQGDAEGAEFPEYVQSIEDFESGMEIDAVWDGQTHAAVIDDVQPSTGDILVEDYDTGQTRIVEPDDITEIVEAPGPYGAPAEVDTSDVSPSDIEPLDDLKVWTGFGWDDATVTEVTEDGTVEVSREMGQTDYYDEADLQSGRAVPESMIGQDPDADDDASDGSDEFEQVPFEEGDTLDSPLFTNEVEVNDVDTEAGTVTLEDSSGNEYEEEIGGANWADIAQPGYVVDEGGSESDVDPVEEYGSDLDEGQDVNVDIHHDLPDNEIGIGQEVSVKDDITGTVVDVTDSLNPKVYVEDDGGDAMIDEGEVITAYPSDNVQLVEGESVEGPDAGSPDIEDIEAGQYVDTNYTTVGYDEPVEVVDVSEDDNQIRVQPNSGVEPQWMPVSAITSMSEPPESPDIPEHAETDLVSSSPSYGEIETGDYVTMGTDVYEVEDTPGSPTGHFTLTGEDGENYVAQDWEIDELVEPAEGSDGEEPGAGEATSPEELHDLSPSIGEEVSVEFPAGPVDAEVVEVPPGSEGPVEIEDENDNGWLVWPDGELESI